MLPVVDMFLIFYFSLMLCCFYGNVNCKCDVILNYKNGLPSITKTLAKNDYIGAMFSAMHRNYVTTRKYWNISDEDCQPRLVKAGKLKITFSLRPRGCCTYCCLIDRAEDYLYFYLEHKNKTRTKICLGDKKRKGRLAAAGVDSKLKTVLLLHAYTENGLISFTGKILTQAFLRRNESYNILRIDYAALSVFPWYVEAIDNTKLIAKAMAKFLKFYHKTGELQIENLHLIGISLGAHLAGFVGKKIRKFRKISRITGLDPAFPLYPDTDKSQRLSDDDAEFVDIIHTDPGYFGFPISLGHADFYISYNNSQYRPGCNLFDLIDGGALAAVVVCDHIRSLLLYVESLDDPHSHPVVTKTPNGTIIGYMGHFASKTTTIGDYYLTTNNKRKNYEHFLDLQNK